MDIEKVAERAALEMVENGIIGHASHVMAATRAVLAIALAAAAEEAEQFAYQSPTARQECCGRGVGYGEHQECCGDPDIVLPIRFVAGRLRTLATQLGAANG